MRLPLAARGWPKDVDGGVGPWFCGDDGRWWCDDAGTGGLALEADGPFFRGDDFTWFVGQPAVRLPEQANGYPSTEDGDGGSFFCAKDGRWLRGSSSGSCLGSFRSLLAAFSEPIGGAWGPRGSKRGATPW